MNAEEILILGAGASGLACAYELSNAGKASTVVEKDDKVGGLAKTIIFREDGLVFRTDLGPHRFYSKNRRLYRMIEKILGSDWIAVDRKTRQHIAGRFYDYPINALQAFRNIGPFEAFLIGLSYAEALFRYRILGKEIRNFEDYIIANFGRRLGEFSMLNYTRKVWGLPCTRIHPDWAGQRIKGLSLTTTLKKALFKGADGPKTLVDRFYYPRFGAGQLYEKIAELVSKNGSRIMTRSEPAEIFHKDGKVMQVKIEGRKDWSAVPGHIVSTIPFSVLLGLLRPAPPGEVMKAAQNLTWRSLRNMFITFNRKSITDDNWLYFPDEEVPFARSSEMRNFSKEMSPAGRTSLMVEYFVTEGDSVWEMGEEELFGLTMEHLQKLGFASRKDVIGYRSIKRMHVYPVYDLDYERNLKTVMDYLDSFKNMICIGRLGRFRYNNQDHGLESGIAAARSIISGIRRDFDRIGSEKEYLEEGYLESRTP